MLADEDLQRSVRERVDAAVDRIRSAYDDVEYVELEVENDPELFEHGVEILSQDGFLGGAAAWVSDDEERVLMIRHAGDDYWVIPGGGHEPDEDDSLEDAAVREAREEAGVEVTITDCYRLHRKTFYLDRDPNQRLQMVEAWFEADLVGGAIDLDPARWDGDEEISEARWFASPPDDYHEVFDGEVERWDWPGDRA